MKTDLRLTISIEDAVAIIIDKLEADGYVAKTLAEDKLALKYWINKDNEIEIFFVDNTPYEI
jgi:hypothetical protein